MDFKENNDMKKYINKTLINIDKKYLKIKNLYMQKRLELEDKKR